MSKGKAPAPAHQLSPKQYKDYLHYLRTHRKRDARKKEAEKKKAAAKAKRHAAKDRHHAAKVKRKTHVTRPDAVPGWWILGGNDRYDSCAAAAVANSLLACTGLRVSDQDVIDLYAAVTGGGDDGASIADVLAVVGATGLGGAQLLAADKLDDDTPPVDLHRGLIADVNLMEAQRIQAAWDWCPSAPWGPHAVCLHDGGVIAWGAAVPVTAAFLDLQVVTAWRLQWQRG